MATIKIQQTKSRIGAPKDQKRTLDALGLTKLNHIVEKERGCGKINAPHTVLTIRVLSEKCKNRAKNLAEKFAQSGKRQ